MTQPRQTALAVAAIAFAVLAAAFFLTQRGATAHVTGTVRATGPTTTIALTASSSPNRLWCKLQHRRFKTLPALKPEGFCFARRTGLSLAKDDILVSPRPDPRVNPG